MNKKWTLIFDPKCLKSFRKMDKHIQKRVTKYIDERVLPDPHNLAEPLSNDMVGFHRFRFANYRLICKIKESQLTIFLIKIDHRRTAYKSH